MTNDEIPSINVDPWPLVETSFICRSCPLRSTITGFTGNSLDASVIAVSVLSNPTCKAASARDAVSNITKHPRQNTDKTFRRGT